MARSGGCFRQMRCMLRCQQAVCVLAVQLPESNQPPVQLLSQPTIETTCQPAMHRSLPPLCSLDTSIEQEHSDTICAKVNSLELKRIFALNKFTSRGAQYNSFPIYSGYMSLINRRLQPQARIKRRKPWNARAQQEGLRDAMSTCRCWLESSSTMLPTSKYRYNAPCSAPLRYWRRTATDCCGAIPKLTGA